MPSVGVPGAEVPFQLGPSSELTESDVVLVAIEHLTNSRRWGEITLESEKPSSDFRPSRFPAISELSDSFDVQCSPTLSSLMIH